MRKLMLKKSLAGLTTLMAVSALAGTASAQRLEAFYTPEALRVAGANYDNVPAGWDVVHHVLVAPEVIKAHTRLAMNRQIGDVKNPTEARQRFDAWRNSPDAKKTMAAMQRGMTSAALLSHYRIDKLPAVVIDKTAIVYGAASLQDAVEAFSAATGEVAKEAVR